MRKQLAWSIALFLAFLIAGCGGGTSGTDGGTPVQLSGVVRSSDATPQAGARVTIVESGDTTVTDDAGNFTLNMALATGRFTVEIELRGSVGRSAEIEAPAGTQSLYAELSLSEAGLEVRIDAISFSGPEAGDPAPTPTPLPNDPPPADSAGVTVIDGDAAWDTGVPAQGVELSVAGRAGRGRTDDEGAFRFEIQSRSGPATLRIRYAQTSTHVALPTLPEGDLRVYLRLRLSLLLLIPSDKDTNRPTQEYIQASLVQRTVEARN